MSGIEGSGSAADLMQQVQQLQQSMEQQQSQGVGEAQSSQFSQMVNKPEATEQAGKIEELKGVDIVAQAQQTDLNRINSVKQALQANKVEGITAPGQAGLSKLLGGVMDGQGKLDKIIKLATSGQQFNPTELLAIQAGVYKFSQELELTSKVVEKATSGVKQTLQTQV
ncbi:MAG: ATP-dependent helicase HrpB [Myxococcota bacterium]|jgi:hypothetical protein|nr:ATP-dependent helicase HrpB [Myxococcales bacterium]MEC7751789.1 ATP-dependent helicase HrpB [Myxococcota bacterium]HBU46872.1 ATP-dependent helicase HrpB [Myxococcales bacterium]|tara:strand:- start:1091 stop:1594 length:504 start_codon:yes stop_codon:yes gene_type:complete